MIRPLENPTHQESQSFSTSHSQTSTVPSVGNEMTVLDDPDDLVTKISPSESPTPNDMHLNNSFEHSLEHDDVRGPLRKARLNDGNTDDQAEKSADLNDGNTDDQAEESAGHTEDGNTDDQAEESAGHTDGNKDDDKNDDKNEEDQKGKIFGEM